jgi:hypothetical protein
VLWPSVTLYLLTEGTPGPASSIDSAGSGIVTYLLGWGPLGIALVAVTWALIKGYRLVGPDAAIAMREEGRADLIAERDRIITDRTAERDRLVAEKREAERERDDALRVTRDQLIPLLINFTAATQSLLPILQGLASQGQRQRGEGG